MNTQTLDQIRPNATFWRGSRLFLSHAARSVTPSTWTFYYFVLHLEVHTDRKNIGEEFDISRSLVLPEDIRQKIKIMLQFCLRSSIEGYFQALKYRCKDGARYGVQYVIYPRQSSHTGRVSGLSHAESGVLIAITSKETSSIIPTLSNALQIPIREVETEMPAAIADVLPELTWRDVVRSVRILRSVGKSLRLLVIKLDASLSPRTKLKNKNVLVNVPPIFRVVQDEEYSYANAHALFSNI